MTDTPRRWWQRVLPWVAVITAISVVGGHIGLWLSDAPEAFKWRLTIINATGWAVVIVPAIGVRFWLAAKLRDTDTD